MATLVLSAVGTALGGPIGGALGSLVGQAIDQQLFGAGPRKGPRLGDLAVQTASYGTMIPRVYGTMRVAGSVVWATDLTETETAVSGGKGASDVLRYAYTASFAVAVSSRRALRIGRIWADGKLLRGAAGDLKVAGSMRFHDGGEGQSVDPLIASVEGVSGATAFRGIALAVFEDLAVADYGNRIPMLTFEVVADEGQVGIGALLRDASGGAIDCAASATLGGYAAHGANIGDAIGVVVELGEVRLHESGGVLTDRGAIGWSVAGSEIGCATAGGSGQAYRIERSRRPLGEMPARLGLSYYDPARDYQAGLAEAGEASGRTGRAVDFAASVSADRARGLAEARLARLWAEREEVRVTLPPGFVELAPGDVLSLAELPGAWRVVEVEIKALVVSARLVREAGGAVAVAGDAGRASAGADAVALPTALVLMDLPDLGDGAGTVSLLVAAASAGTFRPISVSVTANGGARAAVAVERAAVIGRATSVLGAGSAVLHDEVNAVVVSLVNAAAHLLNCDDAALAAGANLAMVGDELIQFGRAEPMSGGRYRLSRLLRGRRGSEWAMAGHAAGEAFVLIERERLARIVLPGEMVGATVVAVPNGLGDGAAVGFSRVASGESLRPPSPCQLHAARDAAGLSIGWTRRSRAGWGWIDAIDAPLGEASEGYRVRLFQGAVERQWTCSAAALAVASSDLAGFASGAATVAVRQVGDRAASRETTLTINL